MKAPLTLAVVLAAFVAPSHVAAQSEVAGQVQIAIDSDDIGGVVASRFGPNLFDVLDRQAGAAPGFDYSPAFR